MRKVDRIRQLEKAVANLSRLEDQDYLRMANAHALLEDRIKALEGRLKELTEVVEPTTGYVSFIDAGGNRIASFNPASGGGNVYVSGS